ncbi:hypothetical protein GCM10008018_42360 [Paenibacillus marchantiophytorum]|uniref:Uncharacterized protein n=1 Tax=Paenibacillus marchantiophytorum TaxID=1619310 RepID=A0ABQ1EXZ2_9BACL|nr:hypothetical protein [Paenibacillus marchantiophytorum]GFZ91598.1 hypothetical protein GCM10008018_42360 [Paenibacillus marchantiophytorum]
MIDSKGITLTTGDSGPNREYIIHSYKDTAGTKPDGLTFKGITLRDGTTWNFRIQDATNVNWIHSDGFDLVNTSHAVVDQCFAYTGDDSELAGRKRELWPRKWRTGRYSFYRHPYGKDP